MYCLDTNILVDVIRGDEALGDKITSVFLHQAQDQEPLPSRMPKETELSESLYPEGRSMGQGKP